MTKNRAKYLKTIVLLDEIDNFRNTHFLSSSLSSYNELSLSFLKDLRHNILSLYLLKSVLDENSKDLKSNYSFNEIKSTIKNELEFINHIRNKIIGHLDDTLMLRSAQWEPIIFFSDIKQYKQRVLLTYISTFESAINSYIDSNGKHKLYDYEIDLTVQFSRKYFLKTIDKLNDTGLALLLIVQNHLENQNIFYTKEELFSLNKIAVHTNFDLRRDDEINTDLILKANTSIFDQDFLKSLDLSKFEDLKKLQKLITSQISESKKENS